MREDEVRRGQVKPLKSYNECNWMGKKRKKE